jgi:hypothetical protein
VAYEIVTGEASAGEYSWQPTTDEDSDYPEPQSTNIDPQISPPVVNEISNEDEPIVNPRTSGGGLCVYGLVPLAFIPLIYFRKRSRK